MKTIIVDTCFWIALYNPQKHIDLIEIVESISELIEDEEIIIPFPSLYEFLNSKFSRKSDAINFRQLLSRPNYVKLDDNPYKLIALNNFFDLAINGHNDVSFVDEIIKEIILDKKIKVDFLVTFDEGLKNFALSRGVKTL